MFAKPQTGRIAIRVAAGTSLGMGHLVRCSHLAKALDAQGVQPYFLLDHYVDALQPWLERFEVHSLYTDSQLVSQEDDAAACLDYIKEGDWLLVDDYRLDARWQKLAKQKVARIIVVDDLADREHDCDVLIDYRSCVDQSTRYQNLVPEGCLQLLGPDFCLLAEEYQHGVDLQTRSQRDFPNSPFTVLLSLGGGSDLSLLATLLETLVTETARENIRFLVVAGTLSVQSQALDVLAQRYSNKQSSNISVLRGHSTLARFYREADVFVGAAGTSIYEINASNLPSITFSLARNQNNASADLDDLGLFMHLPREEFIDGKAMACLLVAIKKQYARMCSLLALRKIAVDGKGCERVVNCLLSEKKPEKVASQFLQAVSEKHTQYQQELKPGFVVRATDDSEINHYLAARNLEINRKRMSVSELVRRVEHYAWWLQNQRENFVLQHNAENMLYIWHQREHFENRQFLFGGWFVASEACSFDLTALALSWQLEHCEQQYPQATWVAIINKDNRYVNLLNSLHGFKAVAAHSHEARAIEHFFPKANREQFNFVARVPSMLPLEVAL